jgi:outer membrane lipoprotein-sorting protein
MMRGNASPVRSLRTFVIAVVLASTGCHWKNAAEKAAAPIAEKNAAARGGLKAWRAVNAGKPRDPVKLAMAYMQTRDESRAQYRRALARGVGEDTVKPVQLPFVLEMERPRKTRFEIRFEGQTAVQVFDGKKGWKLRPFLGRHEVETFTEEEMRQASQQTDLDGLLIDYDAKGSRVELEGTEQVEGRNTFKLKVTLDNKQVRRLWIDAETFLDVKTDGTRKLDGKLRPVWTAFRDYRPVDGLMIPHLLETTVEGVKGMERIVVERVTLNPTLDDTRFAKPD